MSDQYTLQNPTTQYPQPPFDTQQQNEPGLAQQMNPRPDHSEDSRPGQPAELAGAYVFLASQEASYVLGETLAVTGGMPTP